MRDSRGVRNFDCLWVCPCAPLQSKIRVGLPSNLIWGSQEPQFEASWKFYSSLKIKVRLWVLLDLENGCNFRTNNLCKWSISYVRENSNETFDFPNKNFLVLYFPKQGNNLLVSSQHSPRPFIYRPKYIFMSVFLLTTMVSSRPTSTHLQAYKKFNKNHYSQTGKITFGLIFCLFVC